MGERAFNVLSLCSGAGGLDIGVGLAERDARTVGYVEHEGGALIDLVARMEEGSLDEAPVWTDLRTFDGRPWRGVVDCVIGGYPCQPFSVAGQRKGVDDPRHLWPHVFRIVGEVEPEWCFFENVGNHLRLGYFDVVRPDLEGAGYRVKEGLYEAAEVGAPHKRERLFIMAHRDGGGRREQPRAPREGRHADGSSGAVADARDGQLSQPGRRAEGRAGPRSPGEVVGDTGGGGQRQNDGRLCAGEQHADRRCERVEDSIGSRLEGRERGVVAYEGYGRLDPHAGGSSLFPPGPDDHDAWRAILERWPGLAPAVEPSLRGMADGLAGLLDLARAYRTNALRLTGNGVVPLQAAYAWATLRAALERED